MKKKIIIPILFCTFLLYFPCSCLNENETSVNTPKPKVDPEPDPSSIRFKLKNIDSPLADIHWCGKNYKDLKEEDSNKTPNLIVIVLSHGGSIYRSEDDGFSWDEMRDTFAEAGKVVEKKNKGDVIQIIRSKFDKNTLYFLGPEGISFVTENCGKTVKAFKHEKTFVDFKPSAVNKDWLLATNKKKCEDLSNEGCNPLVDIYLSLDMGARWVLLKTGAVEFSWATQQKEFFGLAKQERILATFYRDVQLLVPGDTYVCYSDDFFKTQNIISEKGYRFYLTPSHLFVLELVDIWQKNFQLKVTPTYYQNYVLTPIIIPIERFKDHSFTILDSSNNQIVLNINHYGEEAKFGNIYVSDYMGVKYSLSLLHNVRENNGLCDFEKIKSIEGGYIANVYEHLEAERALHQYEQPFSNFKNAVEQINNFKKSLISFDGGATWENLRAPEKDAEGNNNECSGDCSLHLRGVTDSKSSPLYSSANSVGIVMGVGNTGFYLATKPGDVNTYFSRDAGHTWFEVRKGSHIYEIGDHGGLIVMAKDTSATNKLLYSWDEGDSWDEVTISKKSFEVINIITEPSNMKQKFIVYGQTMQEKGLRGVLVSVDFSTLHQRVCTGAWQPGADDSDFEFWLPTSKNESKCVLGKRVKYVRRKKDAKCFNGEEFDKRQIVDFCECTESDWECDYGYYRSNSMSPCLPINKNFENKSTTLHDGPPENCSGFYEIPSGYRKITGDYCVGGVNKGPVRKPCNPEALNTIYEGGQSQAKQIINNSWLRNNFIYVAIGLICLIVFIWKKELFILGFLELYDIIKDKLKSKEKPKYGSGNYQRLGTPGYKPLKSDDV